MPLLPPPQAVAQEQALVLTERLARPDDEYRTPLETRAGLAWMGRDAVWVGGRVRSFPRFKEDELDSNGGALRGYVVFYGQTAMVVWNPLTNKVTRFPRLWSGYDNSALDENGTPVGFRNAPWREDKSVPMRGRRLLPVPSGTVGGVYDQLHAAPRGRLIAGTLAFTRSHALRRRACLWTDDRKPPRLLPLLPGCTESSASGVNSRGDVIGLMNGVVAVVWRSGGEIERIPLSHPFRLAPPPGQRYDLPWTSQQPRYVFENGAVIALEGTLSGGRFVRMFYDGDTSAWLPDVLRLENPQSLGSTQLSENGRTLLAVIDGTWSRFAISSNPSSDGP